MRRIAVINQKGGVGKTTTAVNLGAALARLGKRVLICDLDPQCNLTVHVDVDPAAEAPSLYELLRGEATLEQAVRPTREPNLWVLPSSVDLAGVELELVNVVGREVLLRDAFETDERAHGGPRWDHVLVDCPPSLGLLSLNALVLCDEVLVPVQSEFFALQGLSKLTEIVGLVQRRLNPRLRVTGLISCRHDSSTNLGRQVMDDIRAHFGDVLLRSAIRRNVKLAEAPSHGRTIFEYDPESRGAEDYLALARELLSSERPAVAAAAPAASAAPAKPAPPKVAAPAKAPPAKTVPAASAPKPEMPAKVEPPAGREAPAKLVAAGKPAIAPGPPAPAKARTTPAPTPAPVKPAAPPARSAAPPTKVAAPTESPQSPAKPPAVPAQPTAPPSKTPPLRPAAKSVPVVSAAPRSAVPPPSPSPTAAPAPSAASQPAAPLRPPTTDKPSKPATRPAPVPPPSAAAPAARPAPAQPASAPAASNGHGAATPAPSEPAAPVARPAPPAPSAQPVPAPRRPARRVPRPPPEAASQDP